MTASSETEILDLRAMEEEFWREESRFNLDRMRQLMSDDFREFGKSGRVYNREQILSIPRQPINVGLPLPNWFQQRLGSDAVLVTYDSEITHGNVVQRAHRSSIWTKTSVGWQMRFHQGTPF